MVAAAPGERARDGPRRTSFAAAATKSSSSPRPTARSILPQGRRALRRLGAQGEPLSGVVALGPAVPVSRKSRLGVPIGVRANLELALGTDSFDVLHAHEPGLPSLSYLALRDSRALSVATFHSPERLAYPPGQEAARAAPFPDRRLTAVGDETLSAARTRFPGDYRALPYGIDLDRCPRLPTRRPVPRSSGEPTSSRAGGRPCESCAGFQAGSSSSCGRVRSPAGPTFPGRFATASLFAPPSTARAGRASWSAPPASSPPSVVCADSRAEAAAAGVPLVDPTGASRQPELVGAALGRLAEDAGLAPPAVRRGEGVLGG